MHFDHKIPMFKSYIKYLTLKIYASAKTSRNMHIKKLGSASMVFESGVSPPIHVLKWFEGVQWHDRDTTGTFGDV